MMQTCWAGVAGGKYSIRLTCSELGGFVSPCLLCGHISSGLGGSIMCELTILC